MWIGCVGEVLGLGAEERVQGESRSAKGSWARCKRARVIGPTVESASWGRSGFASCILRNGVSKMGSSLADGLGKRRAVSAGLEREGRKTVSAKGVRDDESQSDKHLALLPSSGLPAQSIG